jgi:hypothetical protein
VDVGASVRATLVLEWVAADRKARLGQVASAALAGRTRDLRGWPRVRCGYSAEEAAARLKEGLIAA